MKRKLRFDCTISERVYVEQHRAQYPIQSIEIQSQTNGNQANTTNIYRLARICFSILKQWQTILSLAFTERKENVKRRIGTRRNMDAGERLTKINVTWIKRTHTITHTHTYDVFIYIAAQMCWLAVNCAKFYWHFLKNAGKTNGINTGNDCE